MNTLETKSNKPEYAGIDISKDALDVSLASGSAERCGTDADGIKQLIQKLKKNQSRFTWFANPVEDMRDRFWKDYGRQASR